MFRFPTVLFLCSSVFRGTFLCFAALQRCLEHFLLVPFPQSVIRAAERNPRRRHSFAAIKERNQTDVRVPQKV